jgi:hypothetical protein
MIRFLPSLAVVLVCLTSTPATPGEAAPLTDRAISIVVYGDDPCPKSTEDEIVVCARRPEEERYRIPKELRKAPEEVTARAWGDRAIALDEISRSGMPNSCSPVGSGGQTGCVEMLMRQWHAARRDMKTNESPDP